MKTLLLFASLLVSDAPEAATAKIPEIQTAENETLKYSSSYIYNTSGELLYSSKNNFNENKFFIKNEKNKLIKIDLKGSNKDDISSELGYLSRMLAAEALIYVKNGKSYNISMFTRICIAETIKNRKNSEFGFYKKYNSYRSVIEYTGYATYAKEYYDTQNWLKNHIAKKRFIQEVIPAAIFVFFNETNFTSGATGFFTPAKITNERYNRFKKRQLIKIENIDPYYEFTFWKY